MTKNSAINNLTSVIVAAVRKSLTIKDSIFSAVNTAKEAGCTVAQIRSAVTAGLDQANAQDASRSYVSALLCELGIRMHKTHADKGTARSKYAADVAASVLKLCKGNYDVAKAALLAARRLLEKQEKESAAKAKAAKSSK